MKNLKNHFFTFALVLIGSFLAVWAYTHFFNNTEVITIKETQQMQYANLPPSAEGNLPDLTYAAENSIHTVVHIMTQSMRGGGWSNANPLLELFGYRQRQEPQMAKGFGSGVILSEDGYIVSNNHVIEGAQKIKVILNDKREFEAKLIGTDPSTDISLLKIEENNLPFLNFGSSSDLKLGEWVLAVGNPFNLTSTVTAGIVSAHARNLGINTDKLSIESFIQTDAAVNPGNSGGALVNQRGELVGINTAIASRTGSYTGYSFAVPATIVKKVVSDLKEFGEVQRALLGVSIGEVTAELAEEYDLDKIEGVFIGGVSESGAANEAGIEAGDVIISVENKKVNSPAELQEKVSQYRPGDDVVVIVKRNNSKKQFTVTLRNKHGDTEIVRDRTIILGAEFEEISNRQKEKLEIEYGIKIKSLNKGKLKDAGIEEGFIITNINKQPIYEVNDIRRIVTNAQGGILIEGYSSDGKPSYYVFGLN